MSVSPLLDLPDSACIASIVVGMTRVIGSTSSPFTLEQQKFKWQGESWSLNFDLPPIKNKIIAGEWRAFALGLEGSYGRFLMGDSSARTPNGNPSGTPLVKGANQTGNILLTDGWTPNTNFLLRKGDYIQLGSDGAARLHMVTENVNSDGSGNANLSIIPALRSSPTDNSAIITQDAKGVFSLIDNSFSWSVSAGMVHKFSFSAEEVI